MRSERSWRDRLQWPVFLLLLALLAAAPTFALEWSGQPSLRRYTPAQTDAHPYSFSVLTLPSGEIFVGNSDGVLRFFGGQWLRIGMPGNGAARSLALGEDGRIYVGGYQHFGVLDRAADGRYTFKSLERGFFPRSEGAPLGEVWDIGVTEQGVYFATSKIIFYVGYDGRRATIDLPGALLALFSPGGRPVVVLRDRRMFQLHDQALRPWHRAAGRVRGLIRDAPDQYWLLTDRGRLFRIDKDRVEPMAHPAQDLLDSASPYVMVPLPSGFAVGTLSGDIVRFSADFQKYVVWPTGAAPVIGLAVDRENHLWASTEADIVRLSLSDAWSLIDGSNGLRGPVTHAAVYQQRLYVSTSVGLFAATLDAGNLRFEAVALAQTEVNHLAVTPLGLVIAAREGIFLMRGEQLSTIVPEVLTWRLFTSKHVAERIYAVEDSGLIVLDRVGDRYQLSQRFTDPTYRFDEIVEASDGSLWVDRLLTDPMRFALHADRRTLLPPAAIELRDRAPDSNAAISQMDEQTLVSTDRALMAWLGKQFVPPQQHALLETGLAPSSELRTRMCGDGSVYAFTVRRLLRRPADINQSFVELRPMDGGSRGIVDVQCTSQDGVAFIGTWSGMVRFDPRASVGPIQRLAPVMEAVRLETADQSTALPLSPNHRALAPFRQIRFEFLSPTLSASWRYQSRLIGYEKQFVPSGSGAREFSALPPGEYVFQARALDETGSAGPLLEYPFVVSAAWYQTLWFKLLEVALLGGLFALVLRWRSRVLRRRNLELADQVHERTLALAQRSQELELANARLSELADLDGLTGVANRRKLEYELDDSWASARASEAPLALLMIDVDLFKQFNDTYGHALGDERLKAIATRLSGWVGPGELLARYGGEEFVLLMPGSSLEVAMERADAIRRDARHAGPDGSRCSVSIGVAERQKHRPQSATQLFEFADLALYRAKNAGRDRVEVYTE